MFQYDLQSIVPSLPEINQQKLPKKGEGGKNEMGKISCAVAVINLTKIQYTVILYYKVVSFFLSKY